MAELEREGFEFNHRRRQERHQYKLTVKYMFAGSIRVDLLDPPIIAWDDNNSPGKVHVRINPLKTVILTQFYLHAIESTSVFVSKPPLRSALVLNLTRPSSQKFYKLADLDSRIQSDFHYASMQDRDNIKEICGTLVFFFNEDGDTRECVESMSGERYTAAQFIKILNGEIGEKRMNDIRERKSKSSKHINHDRLCFCEQLSDESMIHMLSYLGIRMDHQRKGFCAYESGIPDLQAKELLQVSLSSKQSDKHLTRPTSLLLHDQLRVKRLRAPPLHNNVVPGVSGFGHGELMVEAEEVLHSHGQPLGPLTIQTNFMPQLYQQRLRRKKEPEFISLDDDDDGEGSQEETTQQTIQGDSSSADEENGGGEKKETEGPPVKKKRRHHELLRYGNVELSFEDMRGAWHNEMVNDNIIDLYLQILLHPKNEADTEIRKEIREKTHLYTCFFYKRLTEGILPHAAYKSDQKAATNRFSHIKMNYTCISKWTKKVDIFSKDYLVIPVVDDLHWYLVLVLRPYKMLVPEELEPADDVVTSRLHNAKRANPDTYLLVFDSLVDRSDPKRQFILDVIRDYLELEFADKRKNCDFRLERTRLGIIRPTGIPQQKNYTDCGFFMLQYAEDFLKDPPKSVREGDAWSDWFPDTVERVKYMRKIVQARIQRQCDPEDWKEYQKFEKETKATRDEWLCEDERMANARRKRHNSACARSVNGVRIARAHSEPPSLRVAPSGHNH